MRKLVLATLAAAALAAPAATNAGGWATAGIEPQPPVTAGDDWNVTITILRHGQTPTDGAKPSITIRNVDTGETKTFAATPAGEVGKYEARVEFPSGGTWRYEVNTGLAATGHGMNQVQTFAPVEISGGGAAGTSFPTLQLTAGIAAALALAALVFFMRRRRPQQPQLAPSAH